MYRLGATIPSAKSQSYIQNQKQKHMKHHQNMLVMKTLHHRKVKKKHQKLKVNQKVNWVSRYFCLSFLLIFIHIELDTTGVIEGDNDAPQPMGDPNIEV